MRILRVKRLPKVPAVEVARGRRTLQSEERAIQLLGPKSLLPLNTALCTMFSEISQGRRPKPPSQLPCTPRNTETAPFLLSWTCGNKFAAVGGGARLSTSATSGTAPSWSRG